MDRLDLAGGWKFDSRKGELELFLTSGTVMRYRGGWNEDKTDGFDPNLRHREKRRSV